MSLVIRKTAATSDPAYMVLAYELMQNKLLNHDTHPEALERIDVLEGMLYDELSAYAAETGMDRELCYCSDRLMEEVLDEALARIEKKCAHA